MALRPDFPTDPHAILDPDVRWYPGDDERSGRALDVLLPPLVNRIRRGVKEWRDAKYAGASPTTRALLNHWFRADHTTLGPDGAPAPFRYYFAQREAVESAIWLYEVEQARDPHSLIKYDAAGIVSQRMLPEDWPRYVLKLATGTGKTKAMSLLIAWAYFHRKYEPGSDLSTNFLLIAPNIIVLDRLRVDFDGLRIFHDDPILPEDGYEGQSWQSDFQLTLHIQDEIGPLSDTGNLFLSNVHRIHLTDAEPSIDDEDTTDFFLGKRPKGKAIDSGLDLGEIIRRVPDLVILNDEAHHIHDEKLAWFKSIAEVASQLRLHNSQLSAQFDFTATPRHANGSIFAQTICDYPLVEAIRQRVVKSPVLPDAESRAKLAIKPSADYAQRYEDYLRLGYEEWKKVTTEFASTGKKPLLFVMTDDTAHCDEVGDYLGRTFPEFSGKDAVLVIHTNKSGEVSESTQAKSKAELDKLRKASREVDSPDSPCKAIVSVMVLREGWDVQNVVAIVGLRAFEADNKILPEQTLGRGLRRMFRGEDIPEPVSVIGTPKFIEFVERIRGEGVELEYAAMGPRTAPQSPLVVEVDRTNVSKDLERLDIALPILTQRVQREYRVLDRLAPASWTFRPVKLRTYSEEERREINFKEIDEDRFSHMTALAERYNPTIQNVIGYFADRARRDLRLIGGYAVLHGKIKEFVAGHLFGTAVDLDDPNVLCNLVGIEARNTIMEATKSAINALTIQDLGTAEVVKTLSFARDVRPHLVAHQNYIQPKRSVLNRIVGDSYFELQFAAFLDGCTDIISFIKNSRSTHFHIEYQTAVGGIANYYPDFVVKPTEGDIWVIETKGREDLDDPRKWDRLKAWCEDASRAAPPTTYRALFVRQEAWDTLNPRNFRELREGFAE